MKKLLIACLVFVVFLSSCTAEKDLYGVWFAESQGKRDVIQFSESADGKDAFIWAVYDIENDETISMSKGYFNLDGKTVELNYLDGNSIVLSFSLDGKQLILSSDTASMILTKYELDA